MGWITAAPEWKNLRGVVRADWRKLTEVDLAGTSGDLTCLATCIQERYGTSSALAEQ